MKVLILGAGNAQIDAIEYCKKKGHEVYGCSYTNTDKGIPLLDHFKQLDIKDVKSIEEYVKTENIDIVYSVGSDLAMPTIMRVSEDLGLRHFISLETAQICQNKHLMRTALGNDFDGNIPFIVCDNEEDALTYTQFPGMMKPVDSQGQRGCFRVNSKKDIEQFFKESLSYSKSGKVIIEKFVDGPEISVNGYLQEGILKFAFVSDRIVFDEYPGGIIKEHLYPTRYQDSKNAAINLVKRICEKIGIKNGPVYAQIKLDRLKPVILEITPRLDGCHMWNLIKHYSGNDLLDAAFRHLFYNENIEFSDVDETKKMKLSFMCAKTGSVFDRNNYDVSNALYYTWYYETGEIVKKLNGFMEKGGYQITLY